MINAYDFDKTIYDGDSSIDFYLYCLKRKKSIILLLPIQLYGMLLYILKIKNKEYFKEKFFVFIKKIEVSFYLLLTIYNFLQLNPMTQLVLDPLLFEVYQKLP